MDFRISPAVLEQFPAISLGVIVVSNMDNAIPQTEITTLLRMAEQGVRNHLNPETFKEHPHLAAMQEIHRSFGSNPNKYPPSIQALIKRILKGSSLPEINPLVDLYNIISLRSIVCVGAEDTDRCIGDLELTKAIGNEPFTPLGETKNDAPIPGELVYRDSEGIICRRLNWREGDRTKITEQTKNAVVVIEGFPPFTGEALNTALNALAELIRKYCKAETRIEVLTKEHASCLIR
ncbi:MAG: B3/4 domain-containing protein [Candidatus Peregrinibacteria bacterium]